MKRPTTLLYRVLLDGELQVGCAIERDYKEICSRFEHEGMSFLTIALPILSDALLQGLKQGRITPLMFNGFKPFKRGGSLPAILSGFFIRVFDGDGVLLDHPCIESINFIHLVARLFKKVELPCSTARIKQAYERYVSNDTRVSEHGFRYPTHPDLWSWCCGHLWSDLESVSGELYCFPGVFGSGATAERAAFNERHSIRQWPTRSERSFPSSYHATPSPERGRLDKLTFVEEEDELPVRVVQVPKTLKTPRTISVEPSYMMLMQQSIAKPLMSYIESNRFKYNSIRFTDQSVNRELAREGSVDGSLATIDLSDASDLVSNDLVKQVFKYCPGFLDLIQDCRSKQALLPDSSTINLSKFASQGSALCFPIEAMTFFTIVSYSLLRQTGERPSHNLLKKLTAKVSVYGDDIIVPAEMAAGVMEDLESFGLKVNHEKSFSTGYFRESCGGDYYRGHNVTPTYVRRFDFTGKASDPQIVATYVSLSNQFYMKGMWHACQYIREYLDSKRSKNKEIQRSDRPVGALHYVSLVSSSGLRWNQDCCGYSFRGPVLLPSRKEDRILDYDGALNRAFVIREHESGLRRFRTNEIEFGGDGVFGHNPLSRSGDITCGSETSRARTSAFAESSSPNELGRSGTPPPSENASEPVRKYSSVAPDGLVEYFNFQAKTFAKSVRNAEEIDFDTSVKSYSLKLKNRWTHINIGVPGWYPI